jgi:hypothetical protein
MGDRHVSFEYMLETRPAHGARGTRSVAAVVLVGA